MTDECCENTIKHPSHKGELSHLNRVSGQVDGVKKMIEDGRYCPEILTQLRAIRSAVKSIELRILDTHLSSCVDQVFNFENREEQKKKINEIRDLIKRFE